MIREQLIRNSNNKVTITGTVKKVFTVHKEDRFNRLYKREMEVEVRKKFRFDTVKYLMMVEVYNETDVFSNFKEGDLIRIHGGEIGFITITERQTVTEYYQQVVKDYYSIFEKYPALEVEPGRTYRQLDFKSLLETGFLERMPVDADVDDQNNKLKPSKEKKLYSYILNSNNELVSGYKYRRYRICTEANNIEKLSSLDEEQDQISVTLRGVIKRKYEPITKANGVTETVFQVKTLSDRFQNSEIYHNVVIQDRHNNLYSKMLKPNDIISVKGKLRFHNYFNKMQEEIRYFRVSIEGHEVNRQRGGTK